MTRSELIQLPCFSSSFSASRELRLVKDFAVGKGRRELSDWTLFDAVKFVLGLNVSTYFERALRAFGLRKDMGVPEVDAEPSGVLEPLISGVPPLSDNGGPEDAFESFEISSSCV